MITTTAVVSSHPRLPRRRHDGRAAHPATWWLLAAAAAVAAALWLADDLDAFAPGPTDAALTVTWSGHVDDPAAAARDATRLLEGFADADVTVTRELDALGAGRVHVADDHAAGRVVEALRDSGLVDDVAIDPLVAPAAPTDLTEPWEDKQWGLHHANTDLAWPTDDPGATIAVVDSGVDPVDGTRQRLLDGHNVFDDTADTADVYGHGTPVASLAAGSGTDGAPPGACPTCQVLPVKALDDNGSGRASHLAAAIVWATDHGADVINVSAGTHTATSTLDDAVSYADDHDVPVVAAAGNHGDDGEFWPAAHPSAVAVAGADPHDELYDWSARGDWVDLAAAGCGWVDDRGTHREFCGTSAAAPIAAGTVAAVASSGAHPADAAATVADHAGTDHPDIGGGLLQLTAATIDQLSHQPDDEPDGEPPQPDGWKPPRVCEHDRCPGH